jgi:hypothetical protein
MSRSNPTDGIRNPATRWFTWAGGGDQGYVEWYDKEAKVNRKVDGAFTFLLLDELSTVKGWHEASESSIYANEVRDLRQETLVVKSFKGGELATGLYADIRDKIVAKGGHYHGSVYIAYKEGDELKIGNLGLKGAALSAWMEFKKRAESKKGPDGKQLKAYFVDAVMVTGYADGKKGGTKFRTPVFALKPIGESTNQQALALDAELQAFLADYLKRPKAEASKPIEPDEPENVQEPVNAAAALAAMEDDIPW